MLQIPKVYSVPYMKEMQLDDKVYRPGMEQGRILNAKNARLPDKAYEQNKELAE